MDLEKAERLKRQAELRTLFDTIMVHGHKTLDAQHCTLWLVEDGPTGKCVSTRARVGTDSNEEDMRRAFKLWDIDGDGRLQTPELQRGLQKIGRNKTEESLVALISKYSHEVPGELHYEEFKKLMAETILNEEVILPLNPTGVKGQVYATKKLMNIDQTAISGARRGLTDAYTGRRTQSMLMCPIIGASGDVVGMVEMVNKQSVVDSHSLAFTRQDEKIVEMLATHAAIFIDQCCS